MVPHVVWTGNQPLPLQLQSRCALFFLYTHSNVRSTSSQFCNLLKCNCYSTQSNCTDADANQTQAVTQSCIQNAFSQADGDSKWPTVGRVCTCLCVWDQKRVFSVDWDVGSIPMTDLYKRQIKPALFWWKQADRGCKAASGLSQAAILKSRFVPVHRDWALILNIFHDSNFRIVIRILE